MRIAFLTQYYPPEIGAPQGRLSALARAFQRAGHEVTVLTAMPNYPSGRIHAGYGGLVRREVRLLPAGLPLPHPHRHDTVRGRAYAYVRVPVVAPVAVLAAVGSSASARDIAPL